ncbi:glycosyltransferase [Methanobrevibacter ruminantium]|uniref:glycosyltransferase family 2 protein n=1 Tax=Methanobrevibacter ruminantium TaxID=83816 RepID=UPI0026EC88B1|nr:glycosyltransferase [Methanobrevibacter ruminantium]
MVKISIIAPVYNCENYLEESIGSILNQTFRDIEVICIDDGSSDNSLNILNKIASEDSRLKVSSQENQGPSTIRNYGLKKAAGDYLYFFDADDFLVEDALEKTYSNATQNDSDIVMFKFDMYRDNRFIEHSSSHIEKQFPNVDFNDFTFNCYDYRICAFRGSFSPWIKLYKKEFLDKHECFEFPVNLNHGDVPFHVMTFLKASKISYVPEYMYHYRMDNPSSITNNRLVKYDHIFKIIQIVEDFLVSEGLFEEFKKEFDYFKVNRITYEISGRNDEYLHLAKEELSKLDLNNDLLSKNALFKAKSILNSNSINDYNYKIKIHILKKENKSLINENTMLKKHLKKYKIENRNLKKYKDMNKEILNSNSWKITKPLRKFKNLIKK